MPTFEELLAGRELHALSDEEISELIDNMSPEELDKANVALRKARRAPAPSKKVEASRSKKKDAAAVLIQQAITRALQEAKK